MVVIMAVGCAVAAAPAVTAAPSSGVGLVVRAAEPVAGEYLVVLRDGKARASTDAMSMARAHGGTVLDTWSAALNGFAVRMDAPSAARLAADPRVASVHENGLVRLAADQPSPPWGLDRVDQRQLPLNSNYSYDTTAPSVHAYILDTGIRTTHQEFGGRAVVGYDAINDGWNGRDCHGHGTHVAGTLGGATYGVAKAVQLVSVRVLNCYGNGTFAQVISGINWVTANAVRPAVANMSLISYANATVDQAVRNSINSGVTYVVAAGNANYDACYYSPARVAEAITVGATVSIDYRAGYSNYGTCLDLFAPGTSILSAWSASDTATAVISGTSMASPHTAGAAALHLGANPLATPAQVRNALVTNATAGYVINPGTGSPNRLLYVGTAPQPPPPPPPPPPAEPPPVVTELHCDVSGGYYICFATYTGGTPPVSQQWSPGQSGSCAIRQYFWVTFTVTDAIGRTSSQNGRYFCEGFE